MLNIFIELLPTGMLQALILSLVALGVWFAFRLLNFPDLSAEGSYASGAALTAILLIAKLPAILVMIIACIFSGLLGACTALIHLKFKINSLLTGIIMSSIAYSINLKILGKPNIPLFEVNNIMSGLENNIFSQIIFLFFCNILVILPIYYFLKTEKGLKLRAVGLNPLFAEKQGISLNLYTILGLFLSNATIGLAGSLIVQLQNYVDINMGVGVIINSLAALIIGEGLLGTSSLIRQISGPLIGAIIYQQIQGLAMSAGLAPTDLKLFTGLIILIIVATTKRKI